jgi:hypothetical protein
MSALQIGTDQLAVDLINLVDDQVFAATKMGDARLARDILDAVLRRLKMDVSEGMIATGEAERADGAGAKVMFQNMIGDLILAVERKP